MLIEDVDELFETVFASKKGPEIVEKALQKDIQGVAQEFHSFFVEDKKLRHDLGDGEFERLGTRYNQELRNASKALRSSEVKSMDVSDYSPWIENTAWIMRYIDPSHREEIKYMLYLNPKIERMEWFIKDFLEKFFASMILCPVCGNPSQYNGEKENILCPNCKNTNFFFVIKIHEPITETNMEDQDETEDEKLRNEKIVLRRDKIVMGFASKNMVKVVLKIIQAMGLQHFSDKTPYLTHQVSPGIGVSIQPGQTETEDYNETCKEAEEVVSFEKFLTSIIAHDFIGVVEKEKEYVESVYETWKAGKQKTHELYDLLKSKLAPALEHALRSDQRLQNLFSEWTNIKQELDADTEKV